MAFKFPFTNYHELNLNWVLKELKELFEASEENVSTIETYDERLTAVETELPTVSATAQDAAQNAAAASTAAQQATATANAAQENATRAQSIAGYARQEAQAAQSAADAATQAAQQAQATAQNFDGRITQAQNDASTALEASRSFENRVQSAITTSNNAAQTATNAQGIAMRADQNAALALDTLNAQRSELERIGAEQAALITAETEDKKTEIENLAESVLDSIPADYTELSELVYKKAPVIIDTASGAVASFDNGADNMKIQKLVVNIEPLQAGSGDPSPDNIRPISGWTGAEIQQTGVNVGDEPHTGNQISVEFPSAADTVYGGTLTLNPDRTGELVVDRVSDLFSNLSIDIISARHQITYRFGIINLTPPPSYTGVKGVMTEAFKSYYTGSVINYTNIPKWNIVLNISSLSSGRIGVIQLPSDSDITTPTEFLAAFGNTRIVVPLENPVTYQLTESEIGGILTTLYGTNNIWADTGGVTVEYPADTKLYIDGKLAELQATILENI